MAENLCSRVLPKLDPIKPGSFPPKQSRCHRPEGQEGHCLQVFPTSSPGLALQEPRPCMISHSLMATNT